MRCSGALCDPTLLTQVTRNVEVSVSYLVFKGQCWLSDVLSNTDAKAKFGASVAESLLRMLSKYTFVQGRVSGTVLFSVNVFHCPFFPLLLKECFLVEQSVLQYFLTYPAWVVFLGLYSLTIWMRLLFMDKICQVYKDLRHELFPSWCRCPNVLYARLSAHVSFWKDMSFASLLTLYSTQ